MATYGAQTVIDNYLLAQDPQYVNKLLKEQFERLEMTALYKAYLEVAEQSDTGHVVVKINRTNTPMPERNATSFSAVVTSTPAYTSKIYVPVFEGESLPPDTKECAWCGGYTKDDMRGNCGACGAPRLRRR